MQSKCTGEELSILVKLLSNDAPQMAMSYILMQVANWERSIRRMAKLITVEQQSSLSLLPEDFSLFSKLYTQFIDAKMLKDEAPVNVIFLIINNQRQNIAAERCTGVLITLNQPVC